MEPNPNPAVSQVGYIGLLRKSSNFRNLWIGEVISLFGDWFNLIASASLISQISDSGLAIGSLFVIRMLAPFIVSPFAGVITDRFNRKFILIFSDILRAMVVLGFLLVREPQHIWFLYALTAVQLSMSGFFFPAKNAILPDIVDEEDIGTANALSAATWSVMLAIGAALGGIVTGGWGIYNSFIIDSITFIISAFFISRVIYKFEPVPATSVSFYSLAIKEYLNGLAYLKNHKNTLLIALQKAFYALFVGGVISVLQVEISRNIFPIGKGGGISLGLLYAIAGIGSGVGPIIARKFTRDDPKKIKHAITIAYLITIFGLVLTIPMTSFGLVLFASIFRAFGGGINWVFSTQLLLSTLPSSIRGRIFSTEFAIFTLTSAISSASGGWLLDSFGLPVPKILSIMAICMIPPTLLWTFWDLGERKETQPL